MSELVLPARHHDGRHAVADEVGDRPAPPT
jgi:hypothetical protein